MAWAAAPGAVVASVEYRLVPEHPHPAPVEDCYAGFVWLAGHAAELNIDARRSMVAGSSAGGLLAAGVALLACDRKGPTVCAQLLSCPMLDDRHETVSSQQYVEGDLWSRKSSLLAWKLLLGGRDASIYAAPGRATDLSRLPPTFIDVGSADMLRDEDVAYALRLWAHGVQTELHVWPGGFHGFDVIAPSARLSVQALAEQCAWVKSIFGAQ
ncbi:Alpha/beta hydrolase fold-3 [Auricularia subglabra TFB-10046 SS5]|nr:Alpha/beta hydrolase fold-3 [Auricularia subglabra TFB-10046 SS5]